MKTSSFHNRRSIDRHASQSLLESLEPRTFLSSEGTIDLQFVSLSPKAGMTGVVLDGAAPKTYNAGVINFTRTGGTYTTPPAVGDTVSTFCIELWQHVNQSSSTSYDVVPLTEAPVPGEVGSAPMSAATADLLRELWGRYRVGVDTGIEAAAFQTAIWEIVHDPTLNLDSGNFYVNPTDAITTAAKAQAAVWLSSLDGTGPKANLMGLVNATYQDLLLELPQVPNGGEGLTPGFWKQPQHFWAWTGYKPADSFETVFDVDAPGNPTLLEALSTGGGGAYALGRQAVAALLNATSPYVDYKYTVPQIIAIVQNAYAAGDYEATKCQLEQQNELGTKEDIGQFKPSSSNNLFSGVQINPLS